MYYPSTGKLAEVFPPGDSIKEKLDEMGLTVEEFSKASGLPAATIDGVLAGRTALDSPLAEAIEAALGFPAELSLGLQSLYDEYQADRAAAKKVVMCSARRPRRAKHDTIPA